MASGSSSADEIKHRVTHLGCGSSHTICRLDTGLVLSWGRHKKGWENYSDDEEGATPRAVSCLTGKDISLITCGPKHCIAVSLDKKQVYSWDWDDHDRRAHAKVEPVSVLPGVTVLQVACGHRHTLLKTDGGALLTFGANEVGQLGLGTCGGKVSDPCQVLKLKGSVVSIAAGEEHSLVSTSTGKAYAWGRGANGRLGNGTTCTYHEPTKVDLPHVNIKSVCCGRMFSAVINDQGTVYTFGCNNRGQLGLGDRTTRFWPSPIESLSGINITILGCGWNHTVAADGDGNLYSWGENLYGVLGTDHCQEANSPLPIHLQGRKGKNVVLVSCGEHHTIVVTDKAEVYSWGRGRSGQLGHGNSKDLSIPKLLKELSHPNLRPDEFVNNAEPSKSDTRAAGRSASVSDVPGKTRPGTTEEPHTKKHRTQ